MTTYRSPVRPEPSLYRPAARRWNREVHGRSAVILFIFLALCSTSFMLARLFIGGVIGMSDQGDGTRLLCSLGLREGNPYNTSTTDYFYPIWPDHTWYGEDCGANGTGEPYNSTELWFAGVAKWMSTHFTTTTHGLDLRMLGVLFSVLVGLLVAGIAMALPGRLAAKLVTTVALLLVVGDGAFAGYFVSAYSEPAGFVGILLLIIAVLTYLRVDEVRWWHLLFLAAATMLTITAKTQTASLLASVVLVLIARSSWGASVAGRVGRREFRDSSGQRLARRGVALAISRWPAVLVSLGLLGGTAVYLGDQPQRFTVQNDYAAVFIEMLPHSPNPAQDLKELGLPASWISSSGVDIGEANSAAASPEFYTFTEKAGLGARLKVYLRQPSRLASMFGRGLDGMSVLRANYIYSYPPNSGHGPNSAECRVCVLQWTWKSLFKNGSPLMILVMLGCVGACGFTALTRSEREARAVGGVGLFLASAVVVQFWVVALTDGASDLIKHMVFSNFMFALLFVVTGAALNCLRLYPRTRPQAPPPPAPRF